MLDQGMTKHLALAAIALLAFAGGTQGARSATAPRPPIVGPIIADFVPVSDVTYYAISVAEPPGARSKVLSIVWSLTPPPNNKSCNHFMRSPTSPTVAIWHHGSGDGCSHDNLSHEGHPGVVRVVVRDAAYTCTATYLGTDNASYLGANSSNGDYPVCVARQTKPKR